MGLFKKKTVTKTYDKENKKPVIKASICNGEQVAGFKDIHTGKIEEACKVIKQTTGDVVDLDTIPIDDELTYQLYQRGQTIQSSPVHIPC